MTSKVCETRRTRAKLSQTPNPALHRQGEQIETKSQSGKPLVVKMSLKLVQLLVSLLFVTWKSHLVQDLPNEAAATTAALRATCHEGLARLLRTRHQAVQRRMRGEKEPCKSKRRRKIEGKEKESFKKVKNVITKVKTIHFWKARHGDNRARMRLFSWQSGTSMVQLPSWPREDESRERNVEVWEECEIVCCGWSIWWSHSHTASPNLSKGFSPKFQKDLAPLWNCGIWDSEMSTAVSKQRKAELR